MNWRDGEEQGSQGAGRSEPNETRRSNRNLSEKRRRDRFNILVQELAGIVSPEEGRKLEKTAVLELAISYLRNHQSQQLKSVPRAGRTGGALNWQPSFTTDPEFNLILTDALDSFTIVIENDGTILYASHSVLSILGYLCNELVGTSLFSHLSEDEALRVWSQLAVIVPKSDKTGVSSNSSTFPFRMKCGRFFSRNSYQMIRCNAAVVRPSIGEKTLNCFVLVGNVTHPQPNRLITSSDSTDKEFSYRLTMDWKYIYIDHRAPSIIGFLPFEILGTSVYEYCGPEDVFNISRYHNFLICVGKVTTCYYRHLTKGQSWVWLRSSAYVSYNQWNSKPESITCTAKVVSFDEVCLNQTETIQRDREHFTKVLSKRGTDSVSLSSWALTPTDPFEEAPDLQGGPTGVSQRDDEKGVFNPRLFTLLLRTPGDQLLDALEDNKITSGDDVEMESNDTQNEHLLWLENITIPAGLSSAQIETHLKLQEEYKKIAEQISKQERQLKIIKKLIEWSRLLLDLDRNFGVFGGESSVDSEASSSVTSR